MIEFRTLGSADLEETGDSGRRPIAVQAKRLALLGYLALAGRGRFRRRDNIVALFWPELDEEHARSALRQSLSYLRRTVGPSVVTSRGEEEIAVDPDAMRCDAMLFDEDVAGGRLEKAMELYRGDYLPESLYEAWLAEERERLASTFLESADRLIELWIGQERYSEAIELSQRVLARDKCWERAYRHLMLAYNRLGDRGQVGRTYQRCAQALRDDLDVSPSPETQELYKALIR